jgi:23S rRNA pseudouridine1911/1915/1917 synthase
MNPLIVLYEDKDCLAVAKPAPLLTQGVPAGIPTLEAMVKDYIKEKYHKPGNVYLGIPHRLDRPVSGVVLFARNSKAAQRLAEQFENRQVAKVYWGMVEGTVEPETGIWLDWVRKIKEESRSEIVTEETPEARRAEMGYRCLERTGQGDLLEFIPATGRMHQIRLQTATRGWPIRGDVLYGSKLPFGPEGPLPRDRIIALHARSLTFLHPVRYEPITVVAPLPPSWNELRLADFIAALGDQTAPAAGP